MWSFQKADLFSASVAGGGNRWRRSLRTASTHFCKNKNDSLHLGIKNCDFEGRIRPAGKTTLYKSPMDSPYPHTSGSPPGVAEALRGRVFSSRLVCGRVRCFAFLKLGLPYPFCDEAFGQFVAEDVAEAGPTPVDR
jgi:hypothetical protein